jgi:hypothetical protein
VTFVEKMFERLSRTPDEIRAENLREWAATIPGATPISDCAPRTKRRVAGVVQNVRIDPREGRDSVEATIIDGSGEMVAKWLGRSSLQGVTLGMGLVIDGTVGVDRDGDKVILNPDYRLVPGPEHG